MNLDPTTSLPTQCPHCRNAFEVGKELAGGITNCPRCGKSVEVTGLRDPIWRIVQLLGALGAGAFGVMIGLAHGPLAGIGAGAGAAGLLWLVSRAM